MWKDSLPQPIYDVEPAYIHFYWRAWELAYTHIRDLPGMPQTPYMDEAFCDSRLWIWDTCFMALFCKYAPDIFPGLVSFHNLLDVMHGDAKLPSVMGTASEPAWTGSVPGRMNPIKIQHPDNPPLFAWAEWESAKISGDRAHITDLLVCRQFPQKHFAWLETLKNPTRFPYAGRETAWSATPRGYRWSGIASGMDNTPRGRPDKNSPLDAVRPDFLWVDALAQQALSAECIANMAAAIGEHALAEPWRRRHADKCALLNALYWDETDGFYYDIDATDGTLLRVTTPASFWPLLAGAATPAQAARCAEKIDDPTKLGGDVPWVSVARDDATFDPAGRYWQGSMWLPTAYAGLCALKRYGLFDTARRSAEKLLAHMHRTYTDHTPATIWECYAPIATQPGMNAKNSDIVRPDFCGWSALGPISIFLEYVIGVADCDAFTHTITWHPPQGAPGRVGVRNLRVGDRVIDLVAEGDTATIRTNGPILVKINKALYEIPDGAHAIHFEL